MDQKLYISACNFLIPEVAQVIKDGDYPDVKLLSFPAKCPNTSIKAEQISELTSKIDPKTSDIILIGSSCHIPDHKALKNKDLTKIHLEQCFELVINRETITHYISKGYYLVTNGWLRSYEKNIKHWGFDKNIAKLFFQESMKGILLLDTKIPGDYLPNLKALSEYMGLPYEILPVGLSYCKRYINSLVFDWRHEVERKSLNERISAISKQGADYSVIFNQLEILVKLTDETRIIQVGFELLNILFAPLSINFTSIINDKEKLFKSNTVSNKQPINSDHCFKINVFHSNELLGYFEIMEIQFPQFIEQYKKMGAIISQIFGLSIANARKYKITIDQKEQLQAYSQELQKINQSKDKFFSIIAHDLKSPFSGLIGFSTLLIEAIQDKDYETVEKGINMISQISNNTYALLLNLLEWSQSQTGKIDYIPESFVLSELISDTVELQKYQAGTKGIRLCKNIPPTIKVNADINMIKTIIRNLISNAIKYTQKGGVITISATTQNSMAHISVSDTGVGIRKEKIEKLFQIEHTESTPGTNKEKGTGLGLILCKEFIEKHKGRIWAESEVEKGSTFHFTIPLIK